MKFTRAKDTPAGQTTGSSRRAWLRSWYIQAALLVIAFVLGAAVYRSGIARPASLFLRTLISSGPRSSEMPAPVQEAAKSIQDEIRMYTENGLLTLYIDLPFENYQKLLDKREEALKIGILNTTDADLVSAKVHLQDGQKMDAKLRLKGDWTDHLEGDKWSFRIEMKGDGQVLGMKQFSIQTPAARNFLNEWAFHQVLLKENVLTTRYHFVNVLLNGKLLGIYALEDHFAAELIESQGRRQGLMIRFNEDLMWDNMSVFWANGINQTSNYSVTTELSASIDAFQEAKLAKDAVLSEEAKAAKDMLRAFQAGERPAAEVLDVDLWGRFFALHDLWDAAHGAAWHNLRFYYNPVTGLLEPVAFDSEPFYSHDPMASITSDFIQTRVFNDPVIRAAYARELKRVTQAGYIDEMVSSLTAEHDRLLDALNMEFPANVAIPDKSVGVDWDMLKQRGAALALELQPADVVRGSYQALNVQPGSTGSPTLALDLVNLMIFPVQVERVEINGKAILVGEQPVTLAPVIDPQNHAFEPTHIKVPLSSAEGLDQETAPKVEVVARLVGVDGEFKKEISGGTAPEGLQTGPSPRQPTLAEVIKQHPFLVNDPQHANKLIVSPGNWDVQGDLILPDDMDLTVPAGTVLRFEQGSILYGNGSLYLLGTADAPVLLTAQNGTWGGIVIVNTPRDLLWQYTVVEKTGGINRSGWVMTGGITFYQASIVLEHTLLGNNQTEDAINVIHGIFTFRDCEFANTFADALDSDFSSGEISNCTFHDIAGDAVDVSGTQATIRGTRMQRITDKGVSVGEKSTITITDSSMDTVGIGVASKDLSKATVTRTEIRSARFAALAAYIKKPVFGPGWIDARDVTIIDTQKAAVAQNGSTVLIDGKAVETVDLDVDRLYSEGILGN